MSAIFTQKTCIALPDVSQQFYVWREEDIKVSNGVTFIRLACSSYSLQQLLSADNPLAPNPIPKYWSLSSSRGINKLIEMRNAQQALSLQEERAPRCNLFEDDTESPNKLRKLRMPRNEIQQKREDLEHMTMSVTLGTETRHVKFLRPISSRDNLFVEYEPVSMGLVLRFIRSEGFDIEREPRQELPAGIHAKGKGYIVKTKRSDDVATRFFKELDAAIAYQSESSSGICPGDDAKEHVGFSRASPSGECAPGGVVKEPVDPEHAAAPVGECAGLDHASAVVGEHVGPLPEDSATSSHVIVHKHVQKNDLHRFFFPKLANPPRV